MAKAKTPKIVTEDSAPKAARGKVLIKKTASELHALIGDAPIGVSYKELKAIVTKAKAADFLSEAGL